jgi:hypothetical protein
MANKIETGKYYTINDSLINGAEYCAAHKNEASVYASVNYKVNATDIFLIDNILAHCSGLVSGWIYPKDGHPKAQVMHINWLGEECPPPGKEEPAGESSHDFEEYAKARIDNSKETFSSGAVRDKQEKLPFHLFPWDAMPRLLAIFAEGAEKYAPRNWEKGISQQNLIQHAMVHFSKYVLLQSGWGKYSDDDIEKEDHLAKAIWNLMACMVMEIRFSASKEICDLK